MDYISHPLIAVITALFSPNDTELCQMGTQRAHLRGALPDEQMAGAMQHQHALCVDRLNRHVAHRRTGANEAPRL